MKSFCLAALCLIAPVAAQSGPERWEKSIAAFEQKIKDGSTKPGSVLFIGSSSIRMWKLQDSFPGKGYVNHGFGGSMISDSIHYFDRAVKPVAPPVILFYAGDNDVAKGKSAEVVHADFRKFVGLMKKAFGKKTRLGFIAIKPSLSRWKLAGEMQKANNLIKADCERDELLSFIDVWTPMIGEDGKPKADLFLKDGLHMNLKGYKIWNKAVAPVLKAARAR